MKSNQINILSNRIQYYYSYIRDLASEGSNAEQNKTALNPSILGGSGNSSGARIGSTHLLMLLIVVEDFTDVL